MAECCCGKSVSAHSIINLNDFNYAISLMDPANYERFHLEYLETSLMRYTAEMQDLVGPVSVDFTIRSMTCR